MMVHQKQAFQECASKVFGPKDSKQMPGRSISLEKSTATKQSNP